MNKYTCINTLLLKQMEERDDICPKDWKRDGESRGFRQLTSK